MRSGLRRRPDAFLRHDEERDEDRGEADRNLARRAGGTRGGKPRCSRNAQGQGAPTPPNRSTELKLEPSALVRARGLPNPPRTACEKALQSEPFTNFDGTLDQLGGGRTADLLGGLLRASRCTPSEIDSFLLNLGARRHRVMNTRPAQPFCMITASQRNRGSNGCSVWESWSSSMQTKMSKAS